MRDDDADLNGKARLRGHSLASASPPSRAGHVSVRGECRKVGYRTKTDAKTALRNLTSRRRKQAAAGEALPGKGERSAYRCGLCGLFHLTSMTKETSARVARMRSKPTR